MSSNEFYSLAVSHDEVATLTISLVGDWRLQSDLPAAIVLQRYLEDHADTQTLAFDSTDITKWDTGLCTFLFNIIEITNSHNTQINLSGLPEGVRRLIALASAVPQLKEPVTSTDKQGYIEQLGQFVIDGSKGASEALHFIGEISIAMTRFLRGKAQYKPADLFLIIQDVGPRALPIVTLISFLVGLILAYMGAVQLHQFGAQIFIADLVSIGMVREMGALMTGIIMAGRTGAAFAAQLGTMQVNEEIDALKTFGIAPIEYLVLPRMLALILMVPLLTLYGSIVGIFAGMLIAVLAFDVGVFEYYTQTIHALDMQQVFVGMTKATVYGVIIAFAGCWRGMQCGRSASAVGEATTSAVVTSIVLIVVAASILTIIFQVLGI